jgi:NAD(P)-dependent dehydrogenase (short-subunit alcohol dehydrogenase family)
MSEFTGKTVLVTGGSGALGRSLVTAWVKDAATTHERAWSAALATGWSEKDLRAAGVRAPGQTAPRARKQRARTTAATTTTEG